jgi:hypothetical protein
MRVLDGMRRFKSVLPTAPLEFGSASEGAIFGSGIGFLGYGETFGCVDGRFSGAINWRYDGWQEKEKRTSLT